MRTDTVKCRRCGDDKQPSGSSGVLRCRSCRRQSQRERRINRLEHVKTVNAAYMARCRADPVKNQALRRSAKKSWDTGGRERAQAYYEHLKQHRPFVWRARLFRASHRGTDVRAESLEAMWVRQQGRCALTGRVLVHGDVHLDHIVPASRGGGHNLDNLRWVCKSANHAKRNLTDEEFIKLCRDVTEWLAEEKGIEVEE